MGLLVESAPVHPRAGVAGGLLAGGNRAQAGGHRLRRPATLTGGAVCILQVALEGDRSLAWGGTPMVLLVTVGVVLLVLFGIVERRVVDPILPFGAFRIRAVAVGNAGNVLIGAAQFLLTSFLPLLMQGVRGEGATATGLVLTGSGFAWSLAAMVGGRPFIILGFRRVSIVGPAW